MAARTGRNACVRRVLFDHALTRTGVDAPEADDDAGTAWDDFLPKNGDSLLSLTSAQRQHLSRKLEQEETILRRQAERLEAKRGTQQADSLRRRAEAAYAATARGTEGRVVELLCPDCGSSEFTREELVSVWRSIPCRAQVDG